MLLFSDTLSGMDLGLLKQRAEIITGIRNFFIEEGYLEVDTPLLAEHLIPESTIDLFSSTFRSLGGKDHDLYLIPSPEVWMKILLSQGVGSMFQICRCFRNCEPTEGIHNPEFTMLEWYTVDHSYMDSLEVTEELFSAFSGKGYSPVVEKPFIRFSMAEAFREFGSVDLEKSLDDNTMRETSLGLGLQVNEIDTWEEMFHNVLVSLVEPEIPKERPVVLYDYPARIPTLSKRKPGTPWCERWELYLRGVEMANCFTEETDSELVKKFFETEMRERRKKDMPVPSDLSYADIFAGDFPACSGVAIGVDRLIMVLLGKKDLTAVVPFPILQGGR